MTNSDASTSFPLATGSASPLHAAECVEGIVRDAERLTLRATKTVDAGDPYMTGHFSGFTIYPGVFVLETVVQAAAAALGLPVRVVRVPSMRFTAPLCEGEVLDVDCSVHALPVGEGWRVDASCRCLDGKDAARIKLEIQAETRGNA